MRARLIHGLWKWGARPGTRRFEAALARPAEAQVRRLEAILALGSGSEFGAAHGLRAGLDVAGFRQRVPLRAWEGFRPWIDAIASGRQGVLTRDPVTRLIPTSGSTEACKLIPSGRASRSEFRAALEPWLAGLLAEEPSLAACCSYWSISPPGAFARGQRAAFPAIPVGFEPDTRYFGPLGWWVRGVLAVPQAVAQEPDPHRFREKTLACLLRRPDLGFVSVWHPSFFGLLLDHLEAHWDALVRRVAEGWDGAGAAGAGDPARALALKRIGPRPAVLWPRLRVLSAWAHAASEGPAKALAARLPGVRLIPKGLAATEGIVSLPWKGRRPLAVTSHFLEFLDERGEARLAHELETGGRYEAVLTTSGGLWRLRTGDLVEVDGWAGATPSVRFLGRLSQVVDLCGEKLHEAHVARALAGLDGILGDTAWRLVLPRADGKGYVLVLDRPAADGEAAAALLDRALQENPHYRLARGLGQLAPVAPIVVPPRAEARLLEILIARGQPAGTAKPPVFSGRWEWLDRLAAA